MTDNEILFRIGVASPMRHSVDTTSLPSPVSGPCSRFKRRSFPSETTRRDSSNRNFCNWLTRKRRNRQQPACTGLGGRLLGGARLQPLVFALLHTLWIASLAAGLLVVALRCLPASRASLRYAAALLAQLMIVLAGLVTWSCLDPAAVQPLVAALWLAGVVLMLVRMALAVADAGRFVRHGRAADSSTVELVDHLRHELGITHRVRVVISQVCRSPAVASVFWPALVMPVSLLTELSPQALRAILLHELAHIRRHDYLINLAQMLIEAVLFFNPAIWWISRQIRIECEACCDALAVRTTGDPLVYSQALADWAERQQGAIDEWQVPTAAIPRDYCNVCWGPTTSWLGCVIQQEL